jgi:hypothetical protein
MMRQFSDDGIDAGISSPVPRMLLRNRSARLWRWRSAGWQNRDAFRSSILLTMPSLFRPPRSNAERHLETRARILFALAGLVVLGFPILYVGMFAPGSTGWAMTLAVVGLFVCPLLAVVAIAESITLLWCRPGSASESQSNALPAFRFHLRRLGAYAISVVFVLALAYAGECLWRATH